MAKKYLIVKESRVTGKTIIEYKRYKCIDGFTRNKELCWAFSKKGALKIIENLKQEYHINYNKGLIDFYLEEVTF